LDSPVTVSFGRFTLDTGARELLAAGAPVHLSPKALDLLALLVTKGPAAVSKAQIHDQLWPDAFVSDNNLPVLIGEIRAALGEDARRPVFIRTVQRFGYAFMGPVSEQPRRNPAPEAACWIAWRGERTFLKAGENVMGREPSSDVRVDAVGVSRRHALVVVNADGVLLRDLASKNGTFVDDRRVASEVPLNDGDEIRLGPIPLTFRRISGVTSTQTVRTPPERKP